MPYVDVLQSIETHMMQQEIHRGSIDFKIISERYYPQINRFVVIYEPIEFDCDILEKIRARTIEKGFDLLTTESYLRTNRKYVREINRLYPKESHPTLAAELGTLKKHELVEELWRKCNFKESSKWTGDMDELAIFYSEDANGIPLLPLSQTIHENQIAVVYYPLMDSEHVDSRLISKDYRNDIDFNRL